MEGVRAAMVIPPGATSSLDLEKRDRKMAKVVIDIVGLEPEKYRLGYTKVKRALYRVNAASSVLSEGFFYLLPYFGCCFLASVADETPFIALLSTLGHSNFSSPLLFFL